MFQIYAVLSDNNQTQIVESPEINRITVEIRLPGGWVSIHFNSSTLEAEEIESRNPKHKALMRPFVTVIGHFVALHQGALAA